MKTFVSVATVLLLGISTIVLASDEASRTTIVPADSSSHYLADRQAETVYISRAWGGLPNCPQHDIAHVYWVPDPTLRHRQQLHEAWLEFCDKIIQVGIRHGANVILLGRFGQVQNWVKYPELSGSENGPLCATFVFIDPKNCRLLEQWTWDEVVSR